MKRLKRVLILLTASALLVFFVLPATAFGENGDTSKFIDVPGSGDDAGQYYVEGTSGEADGEEIPVLCIEKDKTTFKNVEYEETNESIEEMLTDGLTDTAAIKEAEKDAESLELLSKLETGADPVTDQMVAWHYSDEVDPATGSYPTTGTAITITPEQKEAADEIIVQIDQHVEEGKKAEDLNQIVVTLDDEPLGTDDNDDGIIETNTDEVTEHTATATMEDPFITTKKDEVDNSIIVTGTAENKDTHWSILAGSYNVSFAKDSLVTETKSIMTEDGGEGVAEQNYYYFYWGLPQYEQNTMVAHIFAWVDINGDGKLDASFEDKDTLEGFKKIDTVTAGVPGQTVVKTENVEGVDTVVTSPVFNDDNTDYYKIEGGKILKATSNNQEQRQTLLTESADDPYDDARAEYVAGTITINKTDSEGAPLAGAVFNVIDGDGVTIATITSNETGVASYTGLIAGEYSIVEVTAPAGYTIDSFPATFTIDLENSKEVLVVMNSLIPPGPPEDPEEEFDVGGTVDIIQVAGTTQRRGQDKIEVLGVAELPYTGMNATTPLIAGIILLAGLSLVFLSLRKKTASK